MAGKRKNQFYTQLVLRNQALGTTGRSARAEFRAGVANEEVFFLCKKNKMARGDLTTFIVASLEAAGTRQPKADWGAQFEGYPKASP